MLTKSLDVKMLHLLYKLPSGYPTMLRVEARATLGEPVRQATIQSNFGSRQQNHNLKWVPATQKRCKQSNGELTFLICILVGEVLQSLFLKCILYVQGQVLSSNQLARVQKPFFNLKFPLSFLDSNAKVTNLLYLLDFVGTV